MPRRCREPDRLGFGFGRFGESAKLGKARDEPGTIVDRWRGGQSEILEDPLGGQRGEVVGGKGNHALVLAPNVMRLLEIGRGWDAEPHVPKALGDLQRAGAGRKRLVELTE